MKSPLGAAATIGLLAFSTLSPIPGAQSQPLLTPRSAEPVTELDAPAHAWSEHPTISGDGRFIAFAHKRAPAAPFALYLYDRQTRRLTRLPVPGRALVTEASLSTDGRFVVFPTMDSAGQRRAGLSLYDRTTAKVTPLPGLDVHGEPSMPAISGNNRFIAFVYRANTGGHEAYGTRGVVRLYDRQRHTIVPTPGLQTKYSQFWPTLDQDGRYIAFESDELVLIKGTLYAAGRRLYVYDRRNSRFLDLPGLNEPACNQSGHLTGDGRLLVFLKQGARPCETYCVGHIYLYDITRKKRVPLPELEMGFGYAIQPAISANGRFIVFMGATDGQRYRIYLYDRQR